MTYSIYRYRSINRILNNNELRDHYFFLPNITGENDINEDNPVLFFKGSKYYWLGLFRYYYIYVYCNFFYNDNNIQKHLKDINCKNFLNNDIVKIFYSKILNGICIYPYQLPFIFNVLDNIISYYALRKSSHICDKSNKINNIRNYFRQMILMWKRNLSISDNIKAQRNIFKSHINKFSWIHKDRIPALKLIYNIGIEKDYVFYKKLYKARLSKDYIKGAKPLTSLHKSFYNILSSFILPKTCIVSFSTTPTNDAMWANYAGKYTGVCLQFAINGGKLMTNHRLNKIYKVNYRRKLPNYNLFSHLNYSNKNVRYVFREAFKKGNNKNYNKKRTRKIQIKSASVKAPSWKLENERRLIYINPKHHKQVYDIKQLKSITLGSEISKLNTYRVIKITQDLCKKHKPTIIPIYKMYRLNGHIKRAVIWDKNIEKERKSLLKEAKKAFQI